MSDRTILQELGKQLAEIAMLPVQEEKKRLWTQNNSLEKTRPLVLMDQLPWHEIRRSDEMQLRCEDAFLRSIEWTLRSLLYRWNHFACDMVIEHRIDIPMSIRNLNYGIHIEEETLATDPESDVVSHKYNDAIPNEAALNALQPDQIWVDRALDQAHLEICNHIFAGILPVRLSGVQIHAGVWDRIAQMRPAETILWDIIDEPEYTNKVAEKFLALSMNTVDQCEALGILDANAQYIHCTGAYNRELPAPGYDEKKPRAKDCWAFGMAQIFATVSPAMHDEFEIEMMKPLYERFGLLYYGCCEPLERVIPLVRKIKNVRKISVSPWANIEKSAEEIGSDYVFSSKPNPAFLASGSIDKGGMLDQIHRVIQSTERNHTPVELILKDISTVGNHLEVLDEWANIVMNIVER